MFLPYTEYFFIFLFFFLCLIFISLFFFTIKKRKQPYLIYFGLFLATVAVNLLGIWQMPVTFTYSIIIKYTSYGAGLFFFLFYEQIFGSGYKKVNRRLWQIHLLSWVGILLVSQLSIFRLEETYIPYSILNIISIFYVAFSTIIKAYSGNKDARIFTFGLISLMVTLFYDISFAIKVESYAPSQTTKWGLLVFTGCLTNILLKRYVAKGTDFLLDPLTFYKDPTELKLKADSMVLHSLKNEISRLMYLNERNKRFVKSLKSPASYPLEKNCKVMDEALQHMNDMILAVKKTDEITLFPQRLSLNMVISDTVKTYQNSLVHQNIELSVEMSEPILIEFDALHMKECISNILLNSVEAIDHQHGKICISLFRKKHEVILEVTDNGKGIPPNQINEVITPLFTTKKSVSHFGVGLYYVYYVIHKHGGTLSIPYSEIGKGTTVRIQLPMKRKTKPFWSVKALGKNQSYVS